MVGKKKKKGKRQNKSVKLMALLAPARAKVVAKADPNQHSTSIYIKLHSVSSADNSSPYKDMVPIGTR